MAVDRIEWKIPELLSLLTDEGVAGVVADEADRIEDGVQSYGVETRQDSQEGGMRVRYAVIGGYEHGATAEKTREAFLRSLD